MSLRSLVAEKLPKQNCLCILIIFKCIFRYIPNLGSFLVHKLQKSKNIHKVQDNYFSKCPNTTNILPPFSRHQNKYSLRNTQKLLIQLQMITLWNLQTLYKWVLIPLLLLNVPLFLTFPLSKCNVFVMHVNISQIRKDTQGHITNLCMKGRSRHVMHVTTWQLLKEA